jgi:PST family polysaccharide transporter
MMSLGLLYLLRVLIIHKLGIETAGIYQASTAISLLYVGFILEAMGKDFYPTLTAAANDKTLFNSLVNNQMEVGLLLAGPGILLSIALAPLVIPFLYSSDFSSALGILRWQMLGTILRVASWPIGFIFLAKMRVRTFLWTEVVANCIHLLLIWLGLKYFGVVGTGIAFFAVYLFYFLLLRQIVRKTDEFRFAAGTIKIGYVIAVAAGIVFVSSGELSVLSLTVNLTVVYFLTRYAVKRLHNVIGEELFARLHPRLRSFLAA